MTENARIENRLREAIALARSNMEANSGGPFGAIITKDDEVVSKGGNQVTSAPDPTAHAEIVAIRRASQNLNSFDLSGCELWVSCEPCPMCMAAAYWAHIDKIYFAASKVDAAEAGFDDEFITEELKRPVDQRQIPVYQSLREEGQLVFIAWIKKSDKTVY